MWKLGLLCCLVALLAGAYAQGLLVNIFGRKNGPVGQALRRNGQPERVYKYSVNINMN